MKITCVENDYRFIDIGKSIAMFFIIAMHCIRDNGNLIFKLVQVGCIAFFFFASGFLYKEEYKDNDFLKYLWKNVKTCLLPYVLLTVFGIVYYFIYRDWYGNVTVSDFFKAACIDMMPIAASHVWFLFCLFEVKVAFYFIWKLVNLINNKKIISAILLIFIVLLNVLAKCILNYYRAGNPRLNFKLDSAVVALSFYIFGFLCKYLKLYKAFTYRIISLIVFVGLRIVVNYIEINYLQMTNICDFRFENSYEIYYINQILAIISFVALGSLLQGIKILEYVGRRNLSIYLFHIYVLGFFEEIYGKITGNVTYSFSNIKLILFLSTITYVTTFFITEIIKKAYRLIKNEK